MISWFLIGFGFPLLCAPMVLPQKNTTTFSADLSPGAALVTMAVEMCPDATANSQTGVIANVLQWTTLGPPCSRWTWWNEATSEMPKAVKWLSFLLENDGY